MVLPHCVIRIALKHLWQELLPVGIAVRDLFPVKRDARDDGGRNLYTPPPNLL